MAFPVVSAPEPTNLPAKPPLKQIGPGVFKLGAVQLDLQRKTVTFPADVNMTNGLIEYLVVTCTGKTHESLLRTDAEPYQIHVAMLLLGARGAGTNAFPDDASKPLPGDKVNIDIAWKTNGRETRRSAEELVFNAQTKSAMTQGHWVYNGSQIFQGTFIAQQDGSIVAIVADPDALMNNPRPGRHNDEIWLVNTNALPPLNTPLRVEIKLEPAR